MISALPRMVSKLELVGNKLELVRALHLVNLPPEQFLQSNRFAHAALHLAGPPSRIHNPLLRRYAAAAIHFS